MRQLWTSPPAESGRPAQHDRLRNLAPIVAVLFLLLVALLIPRYHSTAAYFNSDFYQNHR